MTAARAHIHVTGRVQGVGYRASCLWEARDRKLVGWVRNLDDGRVEAMVEGPREAIEDLVAWCRLGPATARVVDVAVAWSEATGEFRDFRIAH
jgi:acylphosphatase